MRRIILLVLLTIAIPVLGFAQGVPAKSTKPSTGQPSTEQSITRLDRELMDAMVKKDDAVMKRVALDNYVFINPSGGVQEMSAMASTPGPMFEVMDTSDVSVRINGDTAVLTGQAMVKGKLADGTDISGPYRYMRVFVRQKGDWRLVAGSAVPIKTVAATAPKD
jgi:ketosteroid isomerase-like protein